MQVDHSTARSQGGLGIGLTLARNLAEMHGGEIEAHSAGLGAGTEFVVRLPVLRVRGRSHTDQSIESATRKAKGRSRVLVVDDNLDAAESLAMVLRAEGHEVGVAGGGGAALEMMRNSRPEIVFVDIGMPGMDGHELARRVRQRADCDDMVLVALTGWGQDSDRRRSAESGFTHHLVKPAEPRAVSALIGEILATRRGAGAP